MKLVLSLFIITLILSIVSIISVSIIRIAVLDEHANWHVKTVLGKTLDRNRQLPQQ